MPEKARIQVGNGPGMTIFRPDGKYGFVCSSFTPETKVVDIKTHEVIGTVPQASPFSPNIAATPDCKQFWLTLKDVGKTQVFHADSTLFVHSTLDTGPITNHVNFVRNKNGQFAYISVGGENVVEVYTTGEKLRACRHHTDRRAAPWNFVLRGMERIFTSRWKTGPE